MRTCLSNGFFFSVCAVEAPLRNANVTQRSGARLQGTRTEAAAADVRASISERMDEINYRFPVRCTVWRINKRISHSAFRECAMSTRTDGRNRRTMFGGWQGDRVAGLKECVFVCVGCVELLGS